MLLFFAGLFWAKQQDPLSRKWFKIEASDGSAFDCVVVLPKPIRMCPVIIYVHGSGDDLMSDGNNLRQMAELGLATVSLEYNQKNAATFVSQFEGLLGYINDQKWANTNAIAWVGSSLGANRMWDFALQHSKQKPRLLVQLNGGGLTSPTRLHPSFSFPQCPILLVHGHQDAIFPLEDTKRLASALQSNGVPVELKIIPNGPHDMEPNQKVIFRCIGEYCLMHLSGTNAWQNYHSIAEWESVAPRFWLFCIPAVVWGIGCFIWLLYRRPAALEQTEMKKHEFALRFVAAVLATWALIETAVHVVTPYFAINEKTLAISRTYLVPPNTRIDFEFLAKKPIWQGVNLKTLLNNTELANYNRGLINWQVDESNYQNYVLSPVISGKEGELFNWRRPLWEEFYPRIRHENLPEDAATIVARHLRERVTIANVPNLPHDATTIWLRQITDQTGFEIIYVAALRSVGVPARLDKNGEAEIFSGAEWRTAPRPIVENFCSN